MGALPDVPSDENHQILTATFSILHIGCLFFFFWPRSMFFIIVSSLLRRCNAADGMVMPCLRKLEIWTYLSATSSNIAKASIRPREIPTTKRADIRRSVAITCLMPSNGNLPTSLEVVVLPKALILERKLSSSSTWCLLCLFWSQSPYRADSYRCCANILRLVRADPLIVVYQSHRSLVLAWVAFALVLAKIRCRLFLSASHIFYTQLPRGGAVFNQNIRWRGGRIICGGRGAQFLVRDSNQRSE